MHPADLGYAVYVFKDRNLDPPAGREAQVVRARADARPQGDYLARTSGNPEKQTGASSPSTSSQRI